MASKVHQIAPSSTAPHFHQTIVRTLITEKQRFRFTESNFAVFYSENSLSSLVKRHTVDRQQVTVNRFHLHKPHDREIVQKGPFFTVPVETESRVPEDAHCREALACRSLELAKIRM
jgi:hypothetical protein